MDFGITPEQESLTRAVRELLKRECPPEYAREMDEAERFPEEVFQALARAGWFGLALPKEHGGAGGSYRDLFLLLEELAYGWRAAATAYFSTAVLGGQTLLLSGTPAQQAALLPRIARGQVKFAMAMTEPNVGSDAASLETRAERQGDRFRITGRKMFITGAHVATHIVVAARTNPQAPKQQGITLFIVDRDAPGLEVRKLRALGNRSVHPNELYLDGVEVSADRAIGAVDRGWDALLRTLAIERMSIGAMCTGSAQAALDYAKRYALARTQFGRPIAKFQVIQHKFADLQTRVDASRLLSRRVAWMLDQRLPCLKEAAMAKVFSSETATWAALEGMQIMGGAGYMMEHDMQRFLRDAKASEIGGGATEIQKNIIAREMGL